ncbi:hypothetical protein BH10PSE1_BH10PSE1_01270 [soil metagenome]
MADATTAAKDRIDRALAALERKMLELKARPASAPSIADDDLFARAPGDTGGPNADATARIAALESAGRDASDALARAADQLRGLLSPVQADAD